MELVDGGRNRSDQMITSMRYEGINEMGRHPQINSL